MMRRSLDMVRFGRQVGSRLFEIKMSIYFAYKQSEEIGCAAVGRLGGVDKAPPPFSKGDQGGFVLDRTSVSEARMETLSVVKHLDVLENQRLGLFVGLKGVSVRTFHVETAKKAFGHGIIPSSSLCDSCCLSTLLEGAFAGRRGWHIGSRDRSGAARPFGGFRP